jgi:hypothetical protein
MNGGGGTCRSACVPVAVPDAVTMSYEEGAGTTRTHKGKRQGRKKRYRGY